MVRLGEPLSKDELEDIVRDAKVDGDGRINYTGIVPTMVGLFKLLVKVLQQKNVPQCYKANCVTEAQTVTKIKIRIVYVSLSLQFKFKRLIPW